MARVDAILHRERLEGESRKRTYLAPVASLPDGCIIETLDGIHLVHGPRLFRWTPEGYVRSMRRPHALTVTVLTPRSTVAALRAGYIAAPHISTSSA